MPLQKITKEEIILKASIVFGSEGYHNTSMARLAKECGLQKGSIYHYFKSKEILMEAVINLVHEKYREKVFIIAYQKNLSAKEKVESFIKFSENFFLDSNMGCLMGNIALETVNTQPVFAKSIKSFFEEWILAMAQIFEQKVGKERALELGKQCVLEWEGALMLKRVFNDNSYLVNAHKRLREQLLLLDHKAKTK